MKRRSHQDEGLIFDWSKRDSSGGRLLVAGLIAVGALVTLFIAFRVITPESRSVITRPQQVLVLNPAIPAERALIHQAMDRSFALLPTESAAGALPAAADLPPYQPEVVSFQLKPLPLAPTATADATPAFLTAYPEHPQEAFPAPPPPQTSPAQAAQLYAVVEGEAAARFAGEVKLAEIPLLDPNRPRFRLAVNPEGRVLMALPLVASEDAAVMERLRVALMRLRFEPARSPVQWAEVHFRWEEAP